VECFAPEAVAAAPPQVLAVVVGRHMVTGEALAVTEQLKDVATGAADWVSMSQVWASLNLSCLFLIYGWSVVAAAVRFCCLGPLLS
jgi:hypothetical protein